MKAVGILERLSAGEGLGAGRMGSRGERRLTRRKSWASQEPSLGATYGSGRALGGAWSLQQS